MNKLTDPENIPFVSEECGDTMWDEARLDPLSESTTSHPLPMVSIPVRSPLEQPNEAKTDQLKQDNQQQGW